MRQKRLNNKITSFCRVNDNLNARKKIFKATVFLSYSANQLEELQKQKYSVSSILIDKNNRLKNIKIN